VNRIPHPHELIRVNQPSDIGGIAGSTAVGTPKINPKPLSGALPERRFLLSRMPNPSFQLSGSCFDPI
jgi:hypothetical protein